MTTVTRDTLNAAVDFDAPFHIDPNSGTITRHTGLYAPDVTSNNMGGVWVEPDERWTVLTGHSGQQGYSGPIMHESETLSGGLAERVLSEGGTYVVVAVYDDPDEPDFDGEPVGWAILRYDDEN